MNYICQNNLSRDQDLCKVYSKYWRRDISPHKSTELALVLKALRKVANHIGRNVKPILWAGMADPESSAVLISPDDLDNPFLLFEYNPYKSQLHP